MFPLGVVVHGAVVLTLSVRQLSYIPAARSVRIPRLMILSLSLFLMRPSLNMVPSSVVDLILMYPSEAGDSYGETLEKVVWNGRS